MAEPTLVYFNDSLPDDHPLLAEIILKCIDCQKTVHCQNEVMIAWFVTGKGPICLNCFQQRYEHGTIEHFEELEL